MASHSESRKILPKALVPVMEDDKVEILVLGRVQNSGHSSAQTFTLNYTKLKAFCQNASFQEKRPEYTIELAEPIAKVFPVFAQWILSNKYLVAEGKHEVRDGLASLHCWILGEKLGCPGLQDCAIQKLYYHHYQALSLFVGVGLTLNFKPIRRGNMEYVAANSVKGSLLRQFMYDAIIATQGGDRGQDESAGIGVKDDAEWAEEKHRNLGTIKRLHSYQNKTYMDQGHKYAIILHLVNTQLDGLPL